MQGPLKIFKVTTKTIYQTCSSTIESEKEKQRKAHPTLLPKDILFLLFVVAHVSEEEVLDNVLTEDLKKEKAMKMATSNVAIEK